MQVRLDPLQEPGHRILRRGRDTRALPLHDGQELRHHLRLLVPAEQVGHQAGGQHVVDVLEEALLLNTVFPALFKISLLGLSKNSRSKKAILEKVP